MGCSVVRRVVLPDAFYAIDGLLETYLTVLDELELFPGVAAAELERLAPLMASSALLGLATGAGAERSVAHAALMRHSAAAAETLRAGRPYELAASVAADEEIPLTADEVAAALAETSRPGRAENQVAAFLRRSNELVERYPEAATVEPGPIL